MKNVLLFILLIAGMSSCMSDFIDDDYTYIDPKIKPYYEMFLQEAKARGIEINVTNPKIGFGDLEDGVAGRAYISREEIVIDTVDAYIWKHNPEALIFHELGHLYLHRDHDNKMNDHFSPESIMHYNKIPIYIKNINPLIINNTVYDGDRLSYVNELFDQSTFGSL